MPLVSCEDRIRDESSGFVARSRTSSGKNMQEKKKTFAALCAFMLFTFGTRAQMLSPTLEAVSSARAGGATDFRSGQWALGNKAGSPAGLNQSFFTFDPITFEEIEFARLTLTSLSYDLDPWSDFAIRVENFTEQSLLISSSLVLGPLAPGEGDTLFNSSVSVRSIDGTSRSGGDGLAGVGGAGNGALAFTGLGGLNSAGLGDGNEIIGASVGSLSTDLGPGEQLESGLVSHQVGVTPLNAADPEAFWGVFLWGFQVEITAGDSAVISGRVDLIPGAGTGMTAALGFGLAFGRRRR